MLMISLGNNSMIIYYLGIKLINPILNQFIIDPLTNSIGYDIQKH